MGASELRVSIKDVARVAGVSSSTVSRVLSSAEFGRSETRDRVLRAVRQLDYAGSRLPRVAPTPRLGTLGVVIGELDNPFFAGLATSVLNAARRAGRAVLLSDAGPSAGWGTTALDLAAQCDAMIIWAPAADLELIDELAVRLPCVLLNGQHAGLPSVTADGADGVGSAIDYLVTLGHRALGYAATTIQTTNSLRSRLAAARRQAATHGIELTVIESFGDPGDSARHAVDLVDANGVTAVLAQNDLVAMGLVREFSARGIRVPQDVSVVGCDDSPASRLFLPSLTTIAMPVEAMATRAVQLAADSAEPGERGNSGAPLRLDSRLVVRESTGAPRRQG